MRRAFALAVFLALCSGPAFAPLSRPPITGLSFARIQVSSLEGADKFYGHDLGLPRFSRCWGTSAGTCFFVSAYQDVEIVEPNRRQANDLIEAVGFWTEDASALHSYFLARGLHPGALASGGKGERRFEIADPEEHRLMFLSGSRPQSLLDRTTQASHHMIHTGFVVRDRAATDHFYKDILGFRPYWHGGMKDDKDDWVAMQVPDGTDWVEYMLNISPTADHHTLGVMNHIALGVSDIQAAKAQLIENGWKPGEEPKLGRDGKWQLNVYDPDETRVEFMEFAPKEQPCCSEFTGPHPGPKP